MAGLSLAFIGFDSVGPGELLVLFAVVLIVVGPKGLPKAARKLGSIMATIRRAADEFKRQIMSMDVGDSDSPASESHPQPPPPPSDSYIEMPDSYRLDSASAQEPPSEPDRAAADAVAAAASAPVDEGLYSTAEYQAGDYQRPCCEAPGDDDGGDAAEPVGRPAGGTESA